MKKEMSGQLSSPWSKHTTMQRMGWHCFRNEGKTPTIKWRVNKQFGVSFLLERWAYKDKVYLLLWGTSEFGPEFNSKVVIDFNLVLVEVEHINNHSGPPIWEKLTKTFYILFKFLHVCHFDILSYLNCMSTHRNNQTTKSMNSEVILNISQKIDILDLWMRKKKNRRVTTIFFRNLVWRIK